MHFFDAEVRGGSLRRLSSPCHPAALFPKNDWLGDDDLLRFCDHFQPRGDKRLSLSCQAHE